MNPARIIQRNCIYFIGVVQQLNSTMFVREYSLKSRVPYYYQGVDSGEPAMVGDGEMKKSYRNFILAANSRI